MRVYLVWKIYDDYEAEDSEVLKVCPTFLAAKEWLLKQRFKNIEEFDDNDDETEDFGFDAKEGNKSIMLSICRYEMDISNEIEFFGEKFIEVLLEELLVTLETIEFIENILKMLREE